MYLEKDFMNMLRLVGPNDGGFVTIAERVMSIYIKSQNKTMVKKWKTCYLI